MTSDVVATPATSRAYSLPELPPGVQFAEREAGIPGSPIDASLTLLAEVERDTIAFAMGCPAPELIPTSAFRAIGEEVLADSATSNYAPSEGEPGMRAALRRFLASHGTEVDPECLLVTAGGMQGLDLVCKLFVDPGDVVLAETPTYSNGTATALSYGARLAGVPTDHEGMVVEEIPRIVQRLGRPPRLIYTIPNHQNPSGVTLSLPRRLQLLELAARYDAVVLEDDPYGLLGFEGSAPTSLQSLSGNDARVVAVHTFSKILAAGLRVGWVVAPAQVVSAMVRAKQGMDTCTNVPAQRIVGRYLDLDLLDPHLAVLRESYRARCRTMMQALQSAFAGTGVTWTQPRGGFFLWVRFPGVDAEALYRTGLELGVAVIPGNAFSVDSPIGDAVRLCFSFEAPERIASGVLLLRTAYDRVTQGGDGRG